MVVVDSNDIIIKVGSTLRIRGVEHRVVDIVPPSTSEGYLMVSDNTNGHIYKVYPTLFNGKWDKNREYTQGKAPLKKNLISKGKTL